MQNLILCLFFMSTNLFASWNKEAPQGGTFYRVLGSEPTTLNPISSTDAYASSIHEYIFDDLLAIDYDTYEWEPRVAKSWKISEDGMRFTFYLRKDAKFSDGKPITADDVVFSFEVLKTDLYDSAVKKSYISSIEGVKKIDDYTVEFKAKSKYHRNFSTVAAGIFKIVPKHIYNEKDKEKRKKLNKILVGSGPYFLKKYDKGRKIILEKNPLWWGYKSKRLKGLFNFKRIVFRFSKNETVNLQLMSKGLLDFEGLSPETYVKRAVGKKWGKTLFKKKVENISAKGYSYFAMNLKSKLFNNRIIRKAMVHLVDRELINKKFHYGMSLLATGPWYQQSVYANPNVKPVVFDPKEALRLLRSQGWADTDNDLILDKVIAGKKINFSFTLLLPGKTWEKFATLFKEEASKIGVDIKIKIQDWTSFIKALDERNFEMVGLAWGAGAIEIDPNQIWHSNSIKNKGSNFISYSNPEVDSLINKARETMDRKKRIPILQRVYKVIAEDYPYIFMFNSQFSLYGITKKIGSVKDTFNYGIGYPSWWSSEI